MLDDSKFDKTRNAKSVLDILRTLNAKCTATRIDITDYLRYVFKHPDELHVHPELLSPFEVAKKLEQKS